MYKYLFLITAIFFLPSCSGDSASEEPALLATSNSKANSSSQPKTTAEEHLNDQEVMMIRNNYPTLQSAISGFKDERLMSEDLANMAKTPTLLGDLLVWDSLVGMKWDELNSIPETNYKKMNKDIIAETGKSFCFEGMVHEIQVNRSMRPAFTEALMFVPYEGYIAITAVKSSEDILPDTIAKFCGIATGRRFYQTVMGTDSAPYLIGMFDLPENKQ